MFCLKLKHRLLFQYTCRLANWLQRGLASVAPKCGTSLTLTLTEVWDKLVLKLLKRGQSFCFEVLCVDVVCLRL